MAITKSAWKKVLKKQYVTVDGVTASTATYINGSETIRLSISEKVNSQKKLVLPLKVLFEDEYLAIISKPAGILVSGNCFKTVANALSQNIKLSSLTDVTTPKPVHRLDYGTTGVLLIGKTSSSIRALNEMFKSKTIEKTYYAITIREMSRSGTIVSKIDDKESQSDYLVKQSVPSERFMKLNLVELNPQTGRRHQLRKHLSGIGNPILGDSEYGAEGLILKGKGLYLHAYSLEFIHPFTNQRIFVIDELPQKFRKIFSQAE